MTTIWQRQPVPLVEGMTRPIPLRLVADGEPVALAGLQVALFITSKDGGAVDTTTAGKVTVEDDGSEALRGVIHFHPVVGDITRGGSPYTARAVLTDGAAETDAYPRSIEPLTFHVVGITTPVPVAP